MADIGAIPEWFGTAVVGAVLAVLGYVGKQLADGFATLRAERKRRRARLVELLALIRAGDAAMKVQCENRNRLVDLICSRDPALADAEGGYDHLLTLAYPSMPPAERELYDVVRAITVHTFHPLNQALLEWLGTDTEFRVGPSSSRPSSRLAKYLADLEAHLLLWRAKYQAWIPEHPERALVYMVDEKRHGVGFPEGGAALVAEVLEPSRGIGA